MREFRYPQRRLHNLAVTHTNPDGDTNANANADAVIGPLQTGWRRMNVALSRARRLLVIVGHRRTFTVASTPEEGAAKDRYRCLFATIDRLAGVGEATVTGTTGWTFSA